MSAPLAKTNLPLFNRLIKSSPTKAIRNNMSSFIERIHIARVVHLIEMGSKKVGSHHNNHINIMRNTKSTSIISRKGSSKVKDNLNTISNIIGKMILKLCKKREKNGLDSFTSRKRRGKTCGKEAQIQVSKCRN